MATRIDSIFHGRVIEVQRNELLIIMGSQFMEIDDKSINLEVDSCLDLGIIKKPSNGESNPQGKNNGENKDMMIVILHLLIDIDKCENHIMRNFNSCFAKIIMMASIILEISQKKVRINIHNGIP